MPSSQKRPYGINEIFSYISQSVFYMSELNRNQVNNISKP